MAKTTDRRGKRHSRNLTAYQRKVDAIYKAAAKDAAGVSSLVRGLGEKPFAWADYPLAAAKMDELTQALAADLTAVIADGVRSEWTLSNSENDELCDRVFGGEAASLTKAQRKKYYNNNGKALEAFLARKESGLDLSQRVWRYADQFKGEMELALDLGIRDGKSADALSRDIRSYLREPNRLFRRVRDQHGALRLSQAAKAYHPGRGVYRSSYKNARRLAATETNIAYRTADYLRWQDLDFVVGIRVVLSNNHPVDDICNDLSVPRGSEATKGRGCYPKDFKFTGWHPHCRCFAQSILKTEEEMAADTRRILNGEEPQAGSVNAVTTLPQGFTDWVKANEGRINAAKSLPYFLRDNKKAMKQALGAVEVATPLTLQEKARRNEIKDTAKSLFNGQRMEHADFGKPITMSNKAIKEWLNQPFAAYTAKNEALLRLPELLSAAIYVGSGVDRHNGKFTAHFFQTEINGTTAWIIVRENEKGECWVHSISDNKALLGYITKKKKGQ